MSDSQTPRGDTLSWEYDIPLINNRYMMWDLARVTALSVAIMWALVALMGWFIDGEPVVLPPYVLGVAAGALMGLMLIACLLLGNRIRMTFVIGPEGVSYDSSKREKRLNRATAIIGALAGSATTAGAGMLAASNESGVHEWADIKHVVYHDERRVIVIRDSWHALNRLYVPDELYHQAAQLIAGYHAAGAAQREAEAASAKAERVPLAAGVAWTVAVLAAGVCAHAWYWVDSEVASRLALAGVIPLALAGWSRGPARRLLPFLALPGIFWHAWDLVISALDPIDTWDGSVAYTASLDTGLLVLAAASTASVIGLALWAILGPLRGVPRQDGPGVRA